MARSSPPSRYRPPAGGSGTGTGSGTDTDSDTGSGSGAGCAGGQPLTGIVAITVGWQHACGITEAGTVVCWGGNDNGQLGDCTQDSRSTAVDVCAGCSAGGCSNDELLTGVVAVDAGDGHTCALLETGVVRCWGLNLDGQIGDLTTERLKQFDVGRLKPGTAYARRYPDQQAADGQRIPTLREVISQVKDSCPVYRGDRFCYTVTRTRGRLSNPGRRPRPGAQVH